MQVDLRNDGCRYRGRVIDRGVEERHEGCSHLLAYKINIDKCYNEFPTKGSRYQAVPWHAQDLVAQRFSNGEAVGVWQDERWLRGTVVAQKNSGRQRQYTIDIEGAVNDYEDNSDVEAESDIETYEFDETTGTVESEERIASTETQQRCRIELRSKIEEELRKRRISRDSTTIAKEENDGAQVAQGVQEDQSGTRPKTQVRDVCQQVDNAQAANTSGKKKKEKPNSEETLKAEKKAPPKAKPEEAPHARRRRR